MTNSNINKSKIFMLILGLAMCLALMLGIAMASGSATAFAGGETDPRIPISTVTATSNIDEVVGYGKDTRIPTFTITDDSKARFGTVDWQKYDGSEWKWNEDTIFVEGKYRVIVQIRIDRSSGGGTTHVLDKNGVTLMINGEKWTQDGGVSFGDDYSYAWFYSKEYDISAPIFIQRNMIFLLR